MTPFANRIAAIDYIKATAIVAVVLTHAGPVPWVADADHFDVIVRGVLPLFHVPSFLIVAGFVYATAPVMSTRDLARRLTRILLPYLVASMIVLAAGITRFEHASDVLFMVATGSALGIYYFVFVLAVSITVTYLLTRWSPALPTYALAIGVTWWVLKPFVAEPLPPPAPMPSFWFFRDPRWFYPYFLMGWVGRLNWAGVTRLYARHRRLILCIATIVVAMHAFTWTRVRGTNAALIARGAYVLAFVVGVITATDGRRPSVVIRFASEASYTLYLYHFLFMLPLLPITEEMPAALRTVILVGSGLFGAAAIAAGGRALLGSRSRFVFGT
jgi:fucose 4-O-acetylase-like acetyltransferase